MDKQRKPHGYWQDIANCRSEALKYKSRLEFSRKSKSAYSICWRKKWLDDVCSHMPLMFKRPNGYWNDKKICLVESLKYAKRSEFAKGSPSAYTESCKRGWMDEICRHMGKPRKPVNFWNKEGCRVEALKYVTKIAFLHGAGGAYNACVREGWMEDVCDHMPNAQISKGIYQNKCVYLLHLENFVYVGITNDENQREEYHRLNNTLPNGFSFLVTHDYMNAFEAGEIEKKEIKRYKDDPRYDCLNISNGGELGAIRKKWSKKACHAEALKYQGRYAFQVGSCSAYSTCQVNGWLDDVCGHMVVTRGRWQVKENCRKEALKYSARSEFQKMSVSAYNSSCKNGWLNDVCDHMKGTIYGTWNVKENCRKEALKYSTRNDFHQESGGAYHSSRQSGWIEEICGHMVNESTLKGTWNRKDNCRKEALKYSTKCEFQKNSGGAYNSCRRHGWMSELCEHMPLRAGKSNKPT